jgi:hypothetical protein
MPFERGTFPLTMFKLSGDLPENAVELFNKNSGGRLEDVKDEMHIGWTGHNHLLETNMTEENITLGGFIFANMRNAKKKIPSSQLKAALKIEEMAYIRAIGNADISRKKKKEIKEQVTESLMTEAATHFNGVQFVIDQNDNTVYFGGSSVAASDTFTALFNDTFKIAPIQIYSEELMAEENLVPSSYKGIKLPGCDEDDFTPGRDFLTWLWFYSEESSGEIEVDTYGTFAVMPEGPLTFASEGKGAFESVVRKGNPLNSAEAKTALSIGKKLKKANIVMSRADETWNCTFDADNFIFTGVKLPEGEEMDHVSRFAERMNNLHIFKEAFKAYFRKFLSDVADENSINERIGKWIENRNSF